MSERGFADLTDVTLADRDINSTRTVNVNMTIQGNVAMQVTQSGGQLWDPCKWRHLKTKVQANASGANW